MGPGHVESVYLGRLRSAARAEAECAVLELDALDVEPEDYDHIRGELIARRARLVSEFEEAAAEAGRPYDSVMVERVRHLGDAFRDRVRELRAAAGPRGRA